MNKFEVIAEPRTGQGRGASRRLRRAGKVPGVLYGAGKEALSIEVNGNAFTHQLTNEAFFSHILTLTLGSESERVVLKDLQRHPWKPQILHFDLQRVSETEKLTMRIPIHFINQAACVGVKNEGGVISHLMSELSVICLPKDLPEFIVVDLAEVHVGETVHISDIQMPPDVAIAALVHAGDRSQAVVSVHVPKVEEAPAGADEAQGIAAAPAAAATPAAEPEKEKGKKGG